MTTVKSCTFLKDYTSKDGKTGKIYAVELSDGGKGQSFSEIPAGTSKEDLEITPNGNFPDKIKLIKKNGFTGGAVRKAAGNESFALSYAKDWAIAQLTHGTDVKTDNILKIADAFYNWLESKKK
jgi:hypothetical protein